MSSSCFALEIDCARRSGLTSAPLYRFMENYKFVTRRRLYPGEVRISACEEETLPVLEPNALGTRGRPHDLLGDNSSQIMAEIAEYGAVLLRNFNIVSEADFEGAVTNIRGMQPIDSYLLSERGRTVVEGARFVFHTNKVYKTGGTLDFGGFHTENYYSPDVPRFICFCCLRPSRFGGETGLVNMTGVYRDLPKTLRSKLEEKSFVTGCHKLSSFAERYSISAERVKEICSGFGLSFANSDQGEQVLFVKSSVYEHPVTEKPALLANLSAEVPGLHEQLQRLFISDYSGWKWTYHRLAWRFPILRLLPQITLTGVARFIKSGVERTFRKRPEKQDSPPANPAGLARLGSVFTEEEVRLLAKAMRDHFTSFTWRRGDLLIVDNLQIAHSGMPGFGDRLLRALLCNPVRMDLSSSSSGRQKLRVVDDHKCISKVMEADRGPGV
jgi:alpha-ketoglutarate-dependent taurine dioxygenase